MPVGAANISVGTTQELGPGGNLVDVMEATFETDPPGGSGSVRVPKTGDWEATLIAAIEAEAAALKRVLGI